MKFKIGDVVIIIGTNSKEYQHLIGTECKVVDVIHKGYYSGEWYELSIERNGSPVIAKAECIKLNKPPENKSSWEEIRKITNWHPKKLKELNS